MQRHSVQPRVTCARRNFCHPQDHNCDAKELKVGEGVDEYYEMDRKRVAAVVKYLVDQGIDPTRIDKTYKSATTQSSEIEEDDEDEVKEAKNRRINFIIK